MKRPPTLTEYLGFLVLAGMAIGGGCAVTLLVVLLQAGPFNDPDWVAPAFLFLVWSAPTALLTTVGVIMYPFMRGILYLFTGK